MTDALAASLSDIGFQKGDRVGIYMKNSLELIVAFYALQKLGAWAVWINSIYRKNEARLVLENSSSGPVTRPSNFRSARCRKWKTGCSTLNVSWRQVRGTTEPSKT